MNIIRLRIIELMAKYGKVTAVAEVLGLKQPTVTFHMKKMEQEFGLQLFESRYGRTILTEAGNSLLHYAVKINSLAQEAGRVVKEYEALDCGSLRIGASYVPGTYVLPQALTDFSQNHPKVSLSLTVKPAPVIQELLQKHEIDIGLFSAETCLDSTLVSEVLCEDELVVIFAPAHELSAGLLVDAGQLGKYPLILHGQESNTRQMTEIWAKSQDVEFRRHMEIDSLEAIKQVVALGSGISIVSRLAVANEIRNGSLHCYPLNGVKRLVYVAINADRHRSALVNRFIEDLRILAPRLSTAVY
ncbi:LysR family transcriptional regulator [Sporomusa aerivorans]|uniref:LysR family transcriptional regulator n=1 Tax=Sporomusa aerivorans TaxID=204936 RepID=UPI00352BB4A7